MISQVQIQQCDDDVAEAVYLTVLFGPPGERRHGGVPAVAQRAEPLLLQAADESRTLSIFLPGLLTHDPRARPHVPDRCAVAPEHSGFMFCLCVKHENTCVHLCTPARLMSSHSAR